jgi:hypothetical protein
MPLFLCATCARKGCHAIVPLRYMYAQRMPRHCSCVLRVCAAQVGKFQGESEQTLRAEVLLLTSTAVELKPWSRPPIAMSFTVSH